jgi:hypothetical protein
VLEWRLDPCSAWRIPEATGYDLRVVGLRLATDVVGGVEAWIAAGLPVTCGPADVRE